MKRTGIILSLLVVISVLVGVNVGIYAQPNISKGKIPSYIPDDVRILIERLYSSDPVERGRAAYTLGEMGKKADPSTPYLMEMLGDNSAIGQTLENYSVGLIETTPGIPTSPGEEAAKALVEIEGGSALTALMGALRDRDSRVRYSAVCGLGKMGEPGVKPLIGALMDPDIRVREAAAWVLGETGDARAVKPLLAALKDEDSGVRKYAARGLGEIEDLRAIGPLIGALKDSNIRVRWSAQWALGKMGAPAVGPLIAALRDSDNRTRGGAAQALGEIKDLRAVEPLVAVLRDQNAAVKEYGAWALGEIRDPRAVGPLMGALKDSKIRVRWSAQWERSRMLAQ
jgi:HEAT repeat protein